MVRRRRVWHGSVVHTPSPSLVAVGQPARARVWACPPPPPSPHPRLAVERWRRHPWRPDTWASGSVALPPSTRRGHGRLAAGHTGRGLRVRRRVRVAVVAATVAGRGVGGHIDGGRFSSGGHWPSSERGSCMRLCRDGPAVSAHSRGGPTSPVWRRRWRRRPQWGPAGGRQWRRRPRWRPAGGRRWRRGGCAAGDEGVCGHGGRGAWGPQRRPPRWWRRQQRRACCKGGGGGGCTGGAVGRCSGGGGRWRQRDGRR